MESFDLAGKVDVPMTSGRAVSRSGGQTALWIVGTLFFVQGFGSALTERVWDTSFGVAALLREAGVPTAWDLVVGGLGAVMLVGAAVLRRG
ncbi:hypothetical protein AB0M94_35175 [Streptomyces xanthochromogenes]|uniref:hypothetical protein n=1 Tax=Streptomyces xanthochromogenes TaxID=67384 RepID=UPI00342156A2